MSVQQCTVQSGPLSPVSAFPAVRFLYNYLVALDSLDFASHAPSRFFADAATFYHADNSVTRSSEAIWNSTKSSFAQFEFMFHQTCITRIFGTDLKTSTPGQMLIISLQTIMLCRLKNWEEERMVQVPKTFDFVIGPVEPRRRRNERAADEHAEGAAQGDDEGEGVANEDEDAPPAGAAQEQDQLDQEDNESDRGCEGLHIYEAREWWDTGVLARAIAEKEKEDEKKRFRSFLTTCNGFLGQGRRNS
ncbi:uncharacterized protein K452DRAFT_311870 [Aplosporella prunicola CBS 121167]|uniref:Uncharacterized protein n=1 Tax=Aplosporella prunicola CBS 121167 TaxID=1176127 RepID=A0A6A6B3Z2_9PEZI|nr:uncharacterized protein K452DRAFT_311870 [Aplosporella prunicola CBS 121167]KAF2138093.1 hypothetical protein K452DRAFT_311870 [Aplosporella prunicola CBS 121167]